MPHAEHTWIVTADAGRARFFRPDGALQHLVSARPDLVSSKVHLPNSQAADAAPLETRHDNRKPKEHYFAQKLAQVLNEICADARCEHLVFVAPARFAGELRNQVSPRVRARLDAELHKDLVHLPSADLWHHVSKPVRNIAMGLPAGNQP